MLYTNDYKIISKFIRLAMDVSLHLSEIANHQGRLQNAIRLADLAHDLGEKWFLLESNLPD